MIEMLSKSVLVRSVGTFLLWPVAVVTTLAIQAPCRTAMAATPVKEQREPQEALAPGELYGGGIVAFMLKPGDPGYVAGELHGRIISLEDISEDSVWSDVAAGASATGASLDSGKANSRKIAAQSAQGASAAGLCRGYTSSVECSSYDDWYLPSLGELERLYGNRGELVAFPDDVYWSSTEEGAKNAWGISLKDGRRVLLPKGKKARVRAMRSF